MSPWGPRVRVNKVPPLVPRFKKCPRRWPLFARPTGAQLHKCALVNDGIESAPVNATGGIAGHCSDGGTIDAVVNGGTFELNVPPSRVTPATGTLY